MPITFGDIYPVRGGPPTSTEEASGPPEHGKAPVLFWLALVAMLIGVRILYEVAES